MSERIRSHWYEMRDSLWFLPAVLTALAALLALLTVWIDGALLIDRRIDARWAFSGGAEGARGVLTAIASTMITVTALVFSITVVSLQLAASQLTPRVLRSFMVDRSNQMVLGFFIGTFTYALLVLRAVRSPGEDGLGFIPSLSVTIAIGLALTCVGMLIFFIHHAADSMRSSVVIDRATDTALALAKRCYQRAAGEPPDWLAATPAAAVRASEGGYLLGINAGSLLSLAERHGMTIRQELEIGGFVLPGGVVALVWPEAGLDEEIAGAVRSCFGLGPERTTANDVAFSMQLLVDIGTRALSPAINDPTTAIICIDRLSEILVSLAARMGPDELRRDDEGTVRVLLRGPSFAHLVEVAFAPLRHFGSGDPIVISHLIRSLGRVAALAPPERRPPLVRQAQDALLAARDRIRLPGDRARVETAASWLPAESAADMATIAAAH